MPTPETRLTLPEFGRALTALSGGGWVPSYSRLWQMAATGMIPAEKHGRRYLLRREDVPRVSAWLKRQATANAALESEPAEVL